MKLFNKSMGLKSFIVLWSGQAISSLGSSMTGFALIIWAYKQQGTALSISTLAVCSYLPYVLFSFIAGTLADKWNKKNIMLVSDTIAALGTLTIFVLFSSGNLHVWHLYIVNAVLGFMNAFQTPAATVAVTQIAPKEQYTRVSGMQAFSGSLVAILTPALATAILTFGGIKTILLLDLLSFSVAFVSLLFFIKIPFIKNMTDNNKEPFLKSCLSGLKFLKEHSSIWNMILFFAFINFLSSMAGNSIMPAMILSRTDNNQTILGIVSSAIGIGTLVGSILVTFAKPAKRKTKVIFLTCGISFLLCDVLWALGQNVWIWVFAAFAGNLPLPFMNANLTTIMRTKVPVEMQGRVFSTRDTFQYFTIPLGFLFGGFFADYVFEPFMLSDSPLQKILSSIVGTGKGSGMAVIFLITGIAGCTISLLNMQNKKFKNLDL